MGSLGFLELFAPYKYTVKPQEKEEEKLETRNIISF
jgi:hypothetical protein